MEKDPEIIKRASGKRSKKRKFTGNRFTRGNMCENKSCLNESASGKKIAASEPFQNDADEFEGYGIIDWNILFSNIENNLNCKTCGGDITVKQENMHGLSCKISIKCQNCADLCTFRNSKMSGMKNIIPEVNRRFTYAFRAIGKGHADMKLFCGIMDLPETVSAKSYNASIRKLLSSTSTVAQESMRCAVAEEIKLTGASDIIVSGDGTWKTRGHTSRIGVCAVIGDKCGKVIDIEVLSSYCKACDVWKKRKGTPEYNTWKGAHENECLINHHGSAGRMEVVGMVRIFQRSEILHNAKYVGYIGDGDAKTFQALVESKPYKSDIQKIECVGHIQKRMGTRLRKLKQSSFKCSDGKSIGGKGRLTDKFIDKLSIYYGNAIREHKDSLSEMRKAVWAVYFHTRSTDAEPLHSFCPIGPDSWCQYQQSVVKGNVNTFKHKPTLPASVMDAIKPVFKDLSQPKFLGRCLGGKTQNSNESLNSLIWKLCPKTQGSGRRIAEIATKEAVLLFNEGNTGRLKIMKEFGLAVGNRAKECMMEFDTRRIATAELRWKENTKEMRKRKRLNDKALNEAFVLEEGPMYAAGEF